MRVALAAALFARPDMLLLAHILKSRRKKVGTLAQCLQVGTLAQCLLHLSAMPAPCACQQRAVQRRKRKEEKKAVQNGSIGLCCTARLRGL